MAQVETHGLLKKMVSEYGRANDEKNHVFHNMLSITSVCFMHQSHNRKKSPRLTSIAASTLVVITASPGASVAASVTAFVVAFHRLSRCQSNLAGQNE